MPRRRWHQQPREPRPPFKLGSEAPRNWWCHLMTEQWKSSAEPNSTPLIDVTGGAICPFRNDDHATISVRSMWIDENWQYCSWLCKLRRALHDTCCKNLMFTWCKPALFEDQKWFLVTDWNHDVDRTCTGSLLQCPFFMVLSVHYHLEFNLPCTSVNLLRRCSPWKVSDTANCISRKKKKKSCVAGN